MPHTSTGTVRLITTHVVPPPAAGQNNYVVFVPDHDHLVQNDEGRRRHAAFTDAAGVQHQLPVQDGERRHAVFFDEGGVNHQVWVLDSNTGGVQLQLPSGNQAILDAAQAAATGGKTVRISVQNINNPNNPQNAQNPGQASITSITLPAT